MGNPFRHRMWDGQEVETTSADDRISKVKNFTLDQCNAALAVTGLQKTVERAVQARLRSLGAMHRPGVVMVWIDVNDALPDAETTVLLYMPGAESEPVWPGYFDFFDEAQWLLADGMPAGTVTHWMHFPEPPKGQHRGGA